MKWINAKRGFWVGVKSSKWQSLKYNLKTKFVLILKKSKICKNDFDLNNSIFVTTYFDLCIFELCNFETCNLKQYNFKLCNLKQFYFEYYYFEL
jgi:hypothetical protein